MERGRFSNGVEGLHDGGGATREERRKDRGE